MSLDHAPINNLDHSQEWLGTKPESIVFEKRLKVFPPKAQEEKQDNQEDPFHWDERMQDDAWCSPAETDQWAAHYRQSSQASFVTKASVESVPSYAALIIVVWIV